MTIVHESVMTIENFTTTSDLINDIIEPNEPDWSETSSSSSSSSSTPSSSSSPSSSISPSATPTPTTTTATTRSSATIAAPSKTDVVELNENNESSLSLLPEDHRVDKVYTIGCFDLFHEGHIILLKRMRELGKKVIVGVHDSESIFKLKKRVPIDSTEKRMLNVKTLADEVFCIPSCDPSIFMSCIFDLSKKQTALYVRGDDMLEFPSRKLVETLMPIKFLPYTQGVSSTLLRSDKFAHISSNDQLYLQYNP